MRLKRLFYFLLPLTAIVIAGYFLQPAKTGEGIDKLTHYELVTDWPKLPKDYILGNPTGIGIDSSQNIVVFHRAGRKWPLIGSMPQTRIAAKTILILQGQTGEVLGSWGENLFIMPHALAVDRNDNIWVTDIGLQQVLKFSHEGKLLMTIGERGIAGDDSGHFDRPTDVAVADDGSFFVSDGYRNSRIVKFSPSGKYLFEWGTRGDENGEFNIPHALDLDKAGNVYIADRENNRIQVFDSAGRFLKKIESKTMGAVGSVLVSKENNTILAIDDHRFLKIKHRGSDFFIFDSTGIVQTRVGRSGSYTGTTTWYHDLTTDKEGSVYLCDILGNRIQKFKKNISRSSGKL